MNDLVQVKATLPRQLKRRAFAAFALRDEKFNRWLRVQIEAWLEEVDGAQRRTREGELARSSTSR